jgi:hypothetical protein
MFNTSFSNKIQLKIKKYFFILLNQTRFNVFLASNQTGPAGTVKHAPLFMEKKPMNSGACFTVTVEHGRKSMNSGTCFTVQEFSRSRSIKLLLITNM